MIELGKLATDGHLVDSGQGDLGAIGSVAYDGGGSHGRDADGLGDDFGVADGLESEHVFDCVTIPL